jgi:CRISPR-associated RAMP protein (TIGR02581 family)
MLRHRVSEFEVILDIIPQGPLLIVEGEQEPLPDHALSTGLSFAEGVEEALEFVQDRPTPEKEEKGGVDNVFVRTDRNSGDEPFVPGSSLKGVLRHRAEQLARTMGQGCCNPFARVDEVADEAEVSCSVRIEQRRKALAEQERELAGHEIYCMACPICRLFGCLGLASRLQVADGYLVGGSYQSASRDGVGIDRRRGGAREKVKFQNEVLEAGRFRTGLRVRNFELWQLGVLAYLLDDLISGRIRLGHGTHRGMGEISVEIQSVQLTYFGSHALRSDPDRVVVSGLGTLAAESGLAHTEAYGFVSDEEVSIKGVRGQRDGLRYCWLFPPAQQEQLWAAVAPLWRDLAGARHWDAEGRVT